MDGCHFSYITKDLHFDLYKGFFMGEKNGQIRQILKEGKFQIIKLL
jgi:hypothetical protein